MRSSLDSSDTFRSPDRSIGTLTPDIAGRLLSSLGDLALIVDEQGVVRDFAFGNKTLAERMQDSWLDRRWIDTVTVESRSKVESLLRDAKAQAPPRWRHINHPSSGGGSDMAIMYSAVPLGGDGHTAVIGRDLHDLSQLQQRLMRAQESLEEDHARARALETRYRMLFRLTSEAVLIVDGQSLNVLEANPAAARLLGVAAEDLPGREIGAQFSKDDRSTIEARLAEARSGAVAEPATVHAAASGRALSVAASSFRQDSRAMYLLRLTSQLGSNVTEIGTRGKSRVLELIDKSPDGFVVTDSAGVILSANGAFLELAELATEAQAKGQSVDRWLGRHGVDLNVMLTNLRRRGMIRLFATTLRGEYGSTAEVEISGVCSVTSEQPCLGLTIRSVGQRLTPKPRFGDSLPDSLDKLTDLVGRVTLKELVREATDVIEKMCIEAALRVTHDNRASAAEMLGLSRQSLYVKMRRYELGDLNGEKD